MALSDQLTDLAARTKRLEDTAADTQAKNRAKLEQDREKLHTQVTNEAKQMQKSADEARSSADAWWANVATQIEMRRADLRSKIDERRAERQVDKANRNADDAEDYAEGMVAVAAYTVDAAEYAIVDAAIARSEADSLTTST